MRESRRASEGRLRRASRRARRSDAGRSRLPRPVLAEIAGSALAIDRPSMTELQRRVADVCDRTGVRHPSRASLYNALATFHGHRYRVSSLPPHIVATLYNLAPDAVIPGAQLAFYCFNYGALAAITFAAGLPWLDLYHASRMRGWRPRSRGLLDAVMRARRIR